MRSPRINVSLPPEVVRIVATIARAQGVSQSNVIRDILVEATPVLAKIASALANVERIKAEKRSALEAVLSQAQDEAEHLAATSLALLERIASGTEDLTAKGRTRAARPALPGPGSRTMPPSS